MATIKGEVNKEGIVLRVVKTKESDAMVTALSEEGLFSFYARGVSKLTSKNGPACQALCRSLFSLSQGKGGAYTLSESKLLKNYMPLESDLTKLSALSFLQEVSAKLIQQDEGALDYPYLLKALDLMDSFDPLTLCCLYFAKLLIHGGIGLDVDECVLCQKKEGIVGISYEEGGFVCKDHVHEVEAKIVSPRKLKILRYLFRAPLESFDHIAFEKEECKEILLDLGEYLNQLTGANLKSLTILAKI